VRSKQKSEQQLRPRPAVSLEFPDQFMVWTGLVLITRSCTGARMELHHSTQNFEVQIMLQRQRYCLTSWSKKSSYVFSNCQKTKEFKPVVAPVRQTTSGGWGWGLGLLVIIICALASSSSYIIITSSSSLWPPTGAPHLTPHCSLTLTASLHLSTRPPPPLRVPTAGGEPPPDIMLMGHLALPRAT
jgi:hypothetical protein